MKNKTAILAVFMLMGYAAGCEMEWEQNPTNWNAQLWDLEYYGVEGSKGNISVYTNTTDSYLRLCLNQSFTGGQDRVGAVGDPVLFPALKDFDITFNLSTIPYGASYNSLDRYIGVVDIAEKDDIISSAAIKNDDINAVYFLHNSDMIKLYCKNNLLTSAALYTPGIKYTVNMRKNGDSPVTITLNSSTGYGMQGTCDLDTPKHDLMIPFIKIEAVVNGTSNYPCMDVYRAHGEGNMTLSGNFLVRKVDGSQPNTECTITHTTPIQGYGEYYSKESVTAPTSGISETITYYPECYYDSTYGYSAIHIVDVECANGLSAGGYVDVNSGNTPKTTNIYLTTSANQTYNTLYLEYYWQNGSRMYAAGGGIMDVKFPYAYLAHQSTGVGYSCNTDVLNGYYIGVCSAPSGTYQVNVEVLNYLENRVYAENIYLGSSMDVLDIYIPIKQEIALTNIFYDVVNYGSLDMRNFWVNLYICPSNTACHTSSLSGCSISPGLGAILNLNSSGQRYIYNRSMVLPIPGLCGRIQYPQQSIDKRLFKPHSTDVNFTFSLNMFDTGSYTKCFRFIDDMDYSEVGGVSFTLADTTGVVINTQTPESGYYCFNDTIESKYFTLSAAKSNYQPINSYSLWTPAKYDIEIMRTFLNHTESPENLYNLTGYVLENTITKSGLKISAECGNYEKTNITDTNGKFIFYGIPYGYECRLSCVDTGYDSEKPVFVIRNNMEKNISVYAASTDEYTVSMRVRTYTLSPNIPTPLPGVIVRVKADGYSEKRCTTYSNGECPIEGVKSGITYTVSAETTGYKPFQVTKKLKNTIEDIDLTAIPSYSGECKIKGTVYTLNNTVTVPLSASATVTLYTSDGVKVESTKTGFSESGKYEFNIDCQRTFKVESEYKGHKIADNVRVEDLDSGEINHDFIYNLEDYRETDHQAGLVAFAVALLPIGYIVLVLFVAIILKVMMTELFR